MLLGHCDACQQTRRTEYTDQEINNTPMPDKLKN